MKDTLDCLLEAEKVVARLQDRVAVLERVLESAKLRAGYILGYCRGEEEMRAEARAIKEAVESAFK